MKAATDLLVEGGPSALTVDAVVARSGVAKSTVYRHWATRDELVEAVFQECAPDLAAPPADLDPEAALRHLMYALVDQLGDPGWKRLLPALMLLKAERKQMADLNDEIEEQQIAIITSVLERAVDHGVLSRDVLDDIPFTMARLGGPLFMAAMTDVVPLDRSFADRLVDQLVAGRSVTA